VSETAHTRLGEDGARDYAERGWLVKEALVTADLCADVIARARALVARQSEAERLAGTWPTDMMGRYRLSEDGAVPFWDPSLGDPFASAPDTRLEHAARLGHALHAADPWFDALISGGRLMQVAAELLGGPVRAVQSLIMLKNPKSPLEFSFHHDGAYIHSTPESLVVAWLSLDGAPQDRGGLRLLPQSHLEPPPPEIPPISQGIPVDLKAGDAVFWPAGMLHASPPNRSDRPRTALIAYFVAADAACRIEPCRPGG
jgi:hypothetical protein